MNKVPNNINSHDLLKSLSFCVIDLETTGGNHQNDKIIEVGMVKISELKIAEDKSFLINPQINIPDFIQKLTNISQKDVKDSPIIDDVIEEILDFIGEDIIVAHNTSFDVPFLNSVLSRLGKDLLTNKVICTNVMTRHLIPDILNSNLNYMSRLFNIEHSKAHRAFDDAYATAKLLLKYLSIFEDKGIKKVNQLYYPRNKFELDRLHFNNDFKTSQILEIIEEQSSPCVLTIKGERGLILAVIPIEESKSDMELVSNILENNSWQLITLQLIQPLLEGLFQLNSHYQKFPEQIREELKNYFIKKYELTPEQESKKVSLHELDFIVSHHLIKEQVMAYSFLNLNQHGQALFKIPAQRKKMYQYLLNQINRFEGNQKGRKKHNIHPDLLPVIENYLTVTKGMNKFLYLERKTIKTTKETSLKIIEDFSNEANNSYDFPMKHL